MTTLSRSRGRLAQIGRQAGGKGRYEQLLDEAGRHQQRQAMGGGAGYPAAATTTPPTKMRRRTGKRSAIMPKGRLARAIPRITADTV